MPKMMISSALTLQGLLRTVVLSECLKGSVKKQVAYLPHSVNSVILPGRTGALIYMADARNLFFLPLFC